MKMLAWDSDVLLTHVQQQCIQGHPRLLYTPTMVDRIRETCHSTRIQAWTRLQRAADEALGFGAPIYPDYLQIDERRAQRLAYKIYYEKFRAIVDKGLQSLSLAYLVTMEQRYLQAAKSIALELANWSTGADDATSVYPSSRGNEVGLSIARCLHRAYDWLYPGLTDTERTLLSQACCARARQVYARLREVDFLRNADDSHCGRLIVYLGEMALSLANEAPDADEWLDYALRAVTTVYPYWGTEDGGWAEGLWYARDYLEFAAPFLLSLSSQYGVDIWRRPVFEQLPWFVLNCVARNGEILPFGDGAELEGVTSAGAYFCRLMAFWSHVYNDKRFAWWASQCADDSASTWELDIFHTDLPVFDEIPAEVAAMPRARVFPKVGWAAVHSDFTHSEFDTFLLFKSSPFGSVSHSHADQNAFVIMNGGRALVIPSGYYGPLYGAPHHYDWTQSTRANNCILVDDRGQTRQSASAKGRIVAFENTTDMTYIAGDATLAYEGALRRWYRHILVMGPHVILIIDDIEAHEPARFSWLLHSFEKMCIDGNQVIVTRGQAGLDVTLHCLEGLSLTQSNQFDPPYGAGMPMDPQKVMPEQWHMTATTQQAASRVRIAAVLCIRDQHMKPSIETHHDHDWIRVAARSAKRSLTGGLRWRMDATDDEAVFYGECNGDRVWYPCRSP